MPICQVKRDKFGDVERVLAANGRESLAYKSLLTTLEGVSNTQSLQNRFKSWEGKHIMPITNKRELALALYKQLYSPAFKSWIGDWSKLSKTSAEDPGNGYLIDQLKKTVRVNLLDENGEPKDEALQKVIEGPIDGTFRQVTGSTQPSKASPETLKKVKEFVNRMGVKIEELQNITVNGKKIGATGLADPINGLIQVAQGNMDVALTEEAMHIAVELIEQKNPALFKQMMAEIGKYNLFNEVIRDYKDIKEYQTADGKPDIPKMKKETIAKILAQTVIDKNEGTKENPGFLVQAKTWWEKIVDFLKVLFNRTGMNPFEETAAKILSGTEDVGKVEELTGEDRSIFLQKEEEFVDKIKARNANTAETKDGFEVDGSPVRNTVMGKVEEEIKRQTRGMAPRVINQALRDAHTGAEEGLNHDMRDILERYIDDNGNRRPTEIPHTNPSALDPFDNTMYNTLDNHIKERLDGYPGGTKFFRNITLYDGINTAGKADLIARLPDGKVDILQFKLPDVKAIDKDVPRYKQDQYNVEMDALRRILEVGYGVSRKDFRLTRAIPIRPIYALTDMTDLAKGYYVKEVKIGSTKAQLIADDVLLPIPSTSETTGNEKLDKFLSRMRGLVQRFKDERVAPEKRIEKTQRIAALLASIRKLQVQGKADGVISSGELVVKRQLERYTRMSDAIDKTDPNLSSIQDLNRISSEILDEKDEVELYSDLYRILKDILTDNDEKTKEMLQKARNVSDNAQDSVEGYWDLSVKFRTKKMAAKFGITDEFNPEKQLTWYRRMIRSLSQSSIKAGAILWELVSRINNTFQLEFQNRLKHLQKLEAPVKEWLKGRSMNEMYSKILQMKDGKWNGKFIQQFSRDFYKELREHQESGDRGWIHQNIDIDAYREWYKNRHADVVANASTARLHSDDAENSRRIEAEIKSFEDRFDIDKVGGAGPTNYMLRDFPLSGKWESDEYKELQKSENKPLLDLYNHWRDKLDESLELGMIEEHNGWSWFPNVRKNWLEKFPKIGSSFLDTFRVEAEDQEFGKIDPLTGKPVDEIHANYITDLGKFVKATDGTGYMDYSDKSMDLFKVMALWEREIIKFKLKTESEGLARMLAYTEQGQGHNLQKGALQTNQTGKIQKDTEGHPIVVDNDINARYIKEHIDAVYYGKGTSNESDMSIEVPVKAAVQRINKFFGKEILTVPKEETVTLSGIKGLEAMNRFFMTKTLGVNLFTAASNLFGGTVNTYINQGKFFDKKDISEAELEMVGGRFWSENGKKMAGLLTFFHPYLEDKTNEDIRKLSLSNAVKYFSSDHLFIAQRYSDEHVNQVIGMSFIKNTMAKDGKLLNIREYARKELGYKDKYKGTDQEAKNFEKKLEDRIEEIKKSPEALINYAKIEDDKLVIPGIDKTSDTSLNFRRGILEFIKDALGNTSREDLSLYKRSVMMQSFFMFKNWIPRMLDVRGQSLKYNPGSQQYEWGRIRMLVRAVQGLGLRSITSLISQLGGNNKNIIEVAKKLYKEKQAYYAEQEQDFDMDEAEFIDMYIKGVRSEFKELLLATSLMGILIAARAAAPPRDQDPQTKGMYKWALRGIDKLQDEVNFFYNPSSFTDIVNGSTFPAVSILVDAEKFFKTAIAKLFYEITGDETGVKREKVSKYLFKILPITKELMTYVAIFNNDIAKDYGLKVSSQNGSSR